MCGVAGIVKFNQSVSPDDVSRLQNMLSSSLWRGPDANGMWSNAQAVFGHLRLSIIDLSDAANQPMIDPRGRVIVFNGEIYNYLELKDQLKCNYEFKTTSDTEVILAAYDAWGEDCVKHFNGDWAFSIFDPLKEYVFLSRDRFGIKPLFIYKSSSQLLFGSEVRMLLQGGAPRKIKGERIAEYLKFRQSETRYNSLIEDIFPVEPGTSQIVTFDGTVRISKYYDESNIFSEKVPASFDEGVERFKYLFNDSVNIRMRADVPVGVCLSGGLDSSAITAIASLKAESSVRTFSAIFPGTDADESAHSNSVAKMYKTNHQDIAPTLDDFIDNYFTLIQAQDAPHASPKALARYLVLSEAAKKVKVVLDGQGGDELFGGYGSCYKIYRQHYEEKLGKKLLMTSLGQDGMQSKIPAFKELSCCRVRDVKDVVQNIDRPSSSRDSYSRRQYIILRNKLIGLLHTEDRLTMFNSIEGRVPLLDHRLVEFCLSLPVEFKMQQYDKWLMRSWLSEDELLPPSVIFRADKKGFSTSLGRQLICEPRAYEWFYYNLKSLLREVPGVFRKRKVFSLLSEQKKHEVDNVNRLLAVISLLKYIDKNDISLIS